VKGQRLFVRETTAGDEGALSDFYASEGFEPGVDLDRDGVLVRLVGDLAAHLTWEIERNQAILTHVYVAAALRGKHVGLGLVREAASIARARNLARIVVSGSCVARGFFLRTGFAEIGGELVLEVP
jgi:GNAT superfamily N-acetyltransferase